MSSMRANEIFRVAERAAAPLVKDLCGIDRKERAPAIRRRGLSLGIDVLSEFWPC